MFELKKTEGTARRGEFTCAHGTHETRFGTQEPTKLYLLKNPNKVR